MAAINDSIIRSGNRWTNGIPRVITRSCIAIAIVVFVFSCASVQDKRTTGYAYVKTTAVNTFSLLTYNIAGIPQFVSGVQPEKHVPLISPRLNGFDIVLVQEDFAYHDLLAANDAHPYASAPSSCHSLYCDGLSVFSFCPFSGFTRVPWDECSGIFTQSNDCLTQKGFAYAELALGEGISVDVYNLHMDAGWSDDDKKARASQFAQLVHTVTERSRGKALVIAGDFNSRYADKAGFRDLDVFMRACGLRDASVILGYDYDRIDKVFYRSGEGVSIEPVGYKVESALFADEEGRPLSDHDPITVVFKYEKNKK